MEENTPGAAERFIRAFIEADYLAWVANYTARSDQELEQVFDRYVHAFYSFEVTVLIARPPSPSEEWFEESAKSLEFTFRRPLFKIDQYLIDGKNVYAAYTGSTDEQSSVYYEILVFKTTPEGFRIFSVYHPDFEGGRTHFQGDEFAFPEDRYVDVRRFQAPDDELDLIDFEAGPVSPVDSERF